MLKIPKCVTNAKIVTHKDYDGLVSAIAILNVIKNRIPKERVQIFFTQYGNDEKNLHNLLKPKNKQQFVLVTDYAKLSKRNIGEIVNKITNFKLYEKRDIFIEWCHSLSITDYETFKTSLLSELNVTENKWTDSNVQELFETLKAINLTSINVDNINDDVNIDKPDFVTDHHDNSGGNLYGGLQGEIEINSPSNASAIVREYKNDLFSKEDLDAIDMIDGAKYSKEELENTLYLNKTDDSAKTLAILSNTLLDKIIKTNPKLASWIVKNAECSVKSIYETILQAVKINSVQLEIVECIKMNAYKQAYKLVLSLPKCLQLKDWQDLDNYKSITVLFDTENWKQKNVKDLEIEKTGYKSKTCNDVSRKGDILNYKNFSIQNILSPKNQTTRYMVSLVSFDNYRNPFTVRKWTSFFQSACNPLYKGKIDFAIVAKYVYEDIEKYLISDRFCKKYNFPNNTNCNATRIYFNKVDKLMTEIKKRSGGHGGIFNFQGIDTFKPTSKQLNGFALGKCINYYDAKKYVTEKYTNSKNFYVLACRQICSEKATGILATYKNARNDIMDFAISSCVNWTNKLFPVDASCKQALISNFNVKN